MNRKLFCILTLIFLNKANGMELISPTIQDRVITPAIMLGIGAASGAAQAMIFNHINKKNHINDHCDIVRSAVTGAACTLPLVLTHQFGYADKGLILLAACTGEILANTLYPIDYYFLQIKPLIDEKKTVFQNRIMGDENDQTENDYVASRRFNRDAKEELKKSRLWANGAICALTLVIFIDKGLVYFLDKK